MVSDRQIRQTVARCVDAMSRYYQGPRNRYTAILMTAEVQAVAAWVEELGLCDLEADEGVIRPVRDEVIRRHGEELGARLFAEFLAAFDGFGPIKEKIEQANNSRRFSTRSGALSTRFQEALHGHA